MYLNTGYPRHIILIMINVDTILEHGLHVHSHRSLYTNCALESVQLPLVIYTNLFFTVYVLITAGLNVLTWKEIK